MIYKQSETRKCRISKDGETINVVTYQKIAGVWKSTHFETDKPLPFFMYDSVEVQKEKLLKSGMIWEWI